MTWFVDTFIPFQYCIVLHCIFKDILLLFRGFFFFFPVQIGLLWTFFSGVLGHVGLHRGHRCDIIHINFHIQCHDHCFPLSSECPPHSPSPGCQTEDQLTRYLLWGTSSPSLDTIALSVPSLKYVSLCTLMIVIPLLTNLCSSEMHINQVWGPWTLRTGISVLISAFPYWDIHLQELGYVCSQTCLCKCYLLP